MYRTQNFIFFVSDSEHCTFSSSCFTHLVCHGSVEKSPHLDVLLVDGHAVSLCAVHNLGYLGILQDPAQPPLVEESRVPPGPE